MRAPAVLLLGLACLASACGKDSTTPTTPTQTPVDPTTVERYVGVLQVGGTGFYSFSIGQYGTVNVTLNSIVGGGDDPSTVQLGLTIGRPTGIGCSAGTATSASPGSTPQVTGAYDPGVYCVRISDVGTLATPATFDVTIAHS